MPVSIGNDTLAGSLKREVTSLFGSPRNVGLLVVVALLAGIAGPFGTYEAMPVLQRLLYWLLVVYGTAAAGHLTGTAAEHLLDRLGWPTGVRLLTASFLTALPVFGIVVMVLVAFGGWPNGSDLVILFAQCAAVVGAITLLTIPRTSTKDWAAASATPKLLSRLPDAKRGRLMRLQAQDHYVEVITTSGRTLLAMRFRDAIDEAQPEPGMQVHRSHWVALHAVSGRCRISDRSGLRMSDGGTVPVGRKFRSAVRENGVA